MVCIPQGISTESSQVLEVYSASRVAEASWPGAGMEIIRLETEGWEPSERGRLWRLLLSLTRWISQHRKELNAEKE